MADVLNLLLREQVRAQHDLQHRDAFSVANVEMPFRVLLSQTHFSLLPFPEIL